MTTTQPAPLVEAADDIELRYATVAPIRWDARIVTDPAEIAEIAARVHHTQRRQARLWRWLGIAATPNDEEDPS